MSNFAGMVCVSLAYMVEALAIFIGVLTGDWFMASMFFVGGLILHFCGIHTVMRGRQ
jgi:hypothetical protein